MFSCCCVNKKALKKEQQGVDVGAKDAGNGTKPLDNNISIKSPQKPTATDVASCRSPTTNDKSNSSDEDNNLSGLIMSDGLVGEGCEAFIKTVGNESQS